MPSIQSPLGALPARFRRSRVLVVGCGDIGLRVAALLADKLTVRALSSQRVRVPLLRAAGTTPLWGNLDRPQSLRRLAGLAQRVLHLAPPATVGATDERTGALVQALRRRRAPIAMVYASTSGVYGDCGGDWVDEGRALSPTTPRAQRRADAESRVRFFGRSAAVRTSVLRVPGIYAPNREGGTPLERLRKATPVLDAADDVFTNHIHADDLARACVRALWRGKPQRTYNINDDASLKMGDYFDAAAALYGLPVPPRISRTRAQVEMGAMQLSFMSESRRMVNARMKQELGLRLRFANVIDGLAAGSQVPGLPDVSTDSLGRSR
ncbi:MAG: SDR family oxidoreductase [Rhodoferax sp.]|nr:SDR family oxidoreductase [Rhodoferax sp.]